MVLYFKLKKNSMQLMEGIIYKTQFGLNNLVNSF